MRILLDDVECYNRKFTDWQQLTKEYVSSQDRKGKKVPSYEFTALAAVIAGWCFEKAVDEAWELFKESIFPDSASRESRETGSNSADPRQALMEKLKKRYESSSKSKGKFESFDEFLEFAKNNSITVKVILESDIDADLENAIRTKADKLHTLIERQPSG